MSLRLSQENKIDIWRLNTSEIIFLCMFLCVFPQSILTRQIGLFALTDEFFAILGFFQFIKSTSRKKVWSISNKIKLIFKILIIILSLGWISTLIFGIQRNLSVNLNDCFTCAKFYLIFFYAITLLTKSNIKKISYILYKFVSIYITIGFICLLCHLLFDIGMTEEYRFGIRAYKFINSNAGDYSSILVISLAIIITNEALNHINSRYLKVCCLICLFMTLRGKAIGLGITFIFLEYYLNNHYYINKKALISLSILGVLGGFFQLKYYFIDNITPRSLFFVNGFSTANTYFPFGAGYSTYGSNMAKLHYSPLYEQYGFNNIWGMNAEEQQFLNDNFWPMVMGQFGWIGMVLYVSILIILFVLTNRFTQPGKLKLAGLILFFLIVYSSVGGPILLHYIGCVTAIVYALVIIASKKCFEFV